VDEAAYEEFRYWTLWELWAEPPIWEPFLDTPNHFEGADEGTRFAAAERLLAELHRDGWARFVRRPWNGNKWSAATETELDDAEVAAAIAGNSWRAYPYGEDANIWLVPTEKGVAWKDTEAREAFGQKPASARDQSDE
jgi:hypothetical protein